MLDLEFPFFWFLAVGAIEAGFCFLVRPIIVMHGKVYVPVSRKLP